MRGRGMRVEHLIQNENDEKKCNSKLIGRFGIGLKDAISCLNDNGKTITIESKYLYIKQIKKLSKKGFNNIKTCHLGIEKEKDKKFIGTLIQIHDIEPEEYENVVNMFVSLMDLNLICKTNFGNIYKKHDSKDSGFIFIAGVKMIEEKSFNYHYDITEITPKLRNGIRSR